MTMLRPLNSEADDELVALMRGETDVGLLKVMARRGEDELWGDAAFCEFYNRHKAYMWTVCANVAEDLHGDAWVEDIFVQTFERAYEKAHTFKLPPNTAAEHEIKRVLGWLGEIAANMLRTLLRNHEIEQTQDEEAWDKIVESVQPSGLDEEHDTQEMSAERKLIAEALETLNEREQLVLRITFQYYRLGKKFQRLPNRISQELADQLATTPENLRKIRERALAKVKEYVNQHQMNIGTNAK